MGTFIIKVKSEGSDAKKQEEIIVQIDWRTLREFGQAAKVYTMARLRDLLIQYDEYLKQKEKDQIAHWPPHSIFCEKRCCQKSLTTYVRFLKKELVWGKDGHLRQNRI